MQFYNENAKSYAESTFHEDFAKAIYEGMKDFLNLNCLNAPILDIGCGSGRDAKFLTSLGYKIHAFDQSPEMIEEAKRLTGMLDTFKVGAAHDFETDDSYFFAYSIACLLHLNDEEFEIAINHIFKHLTFGGNFFFTVKKGVGEEVDAAGRYFNYYTEEKLQEVFERLGYHLIDVTEYPDLTRPDTTWLYVLAQKPL